MQIPFKTKKQWILISTVFLSALGIRLFYLPYELPLIIDGMDNFTYATAINYYGYLPKEWTPPNNGWPFFLSFWFSIINLENTFEYMQLQKIISVILSSLIIFPIFILCRKFFNEKLALFGSLLFAFEPRIILNSTLGITEPLFILLGITSLVIFLKYERKWMFSAFILASFCTIVRSEGIFLFFTLSILFFMKYRFSKEIIKTYLPSILIFILILLPIMDYRTEVTGYDAIFQRVALGTGEIISSSNETQNSEIFNGIELFVKYFGWIMIPSFIVFLPLGFIQFLKNRTKETNFIIIFLASSSLPIFYAYFSQAQDTRYFYFLYPIFCLISLFSLKFYLSKISNQKLLFIIIITGLIISSIIFYEIEKIDYEKEKEFNEIAKKISEKSLGINFHPSLSPYIRANELPNEWPFVFFDDMHKIKIVSTENYNNLENYIQNSKNGLTHIVVNDDKKLPKFLKNLQVNDDVQYLKMIYDSSDYGFNNQVKLFEINYEKFDKMLFEKIK